MNCKTQLNPLCFNECFRNLYIDIFHYHYISGQLIRIYIVSHLKFKYIFAFWCFILFVFLSTKKNKIKCNLYVCKNLKNWTCKCHLLNEIFLLRSIVGLKKKKFYFLINKFFYGLSFVELSNLKNCASSNEQIKRRSFIKTTTTTTKICLSAWLASQSCHKVTTSVYFILLLKSINDKWILISHLKACLSQQSSIY